MKPIFHRLAALACAAALTLSLAACGKTGKNAEDEGQPQQLNSEETVVKAPKYVFLFVGDGMSYPQIQSTSDFLGALEDADYWQAEPSLDDNQGAILDGPEYLNFMNFEAAGSAVTYDSNSFCPDSASTATSISTGHKTYSGTINMDETGTVAYETIAEKLKDQLGEGVIVLASVADGRVNLMATATDGAQKQGAHAGNLIKAIAGLVGGGGGGRPGMAQAGGKNPAGVDAALAKCGEALAEQIK